MKTSTILAFIATAVLSNATPVPEENGDYAPAGYGSDLSPPTGGGVPFGPPGYPPASPPNAPNYPPHAIPPPTGPNYPPHAIPPPQPWSPPSGPNYPPHAIPPPGPPSGPSGYPPAGPPKGPSGYPPAGPPKGPSGYPPAGPTDPTDPTDGPTDGPGPCSIEQSNACCNGDSDSLVEGLLGNLLGGNCSPLANVGGECSGSNVACCPTTTTGGDGLTLISIGSICQLVQL